MSNSVKLAIKQQERYASRGCAEFCKENGYHDIPEPVLKALHKHINSPVPIESVEHAKKILKLMYRWYEVKNKKDQD